MGLNYENANNNPPGIVPSIEGFTVQTGQVYEADNFANQNKEIIRPDEIDDYIDKAVVNEINAIENTDPREEGNEGNVYYM